MLSSFKTDLSISFSDTSSGNSTGSNGSYASLDNSLLGLVQQTVHKSSGTGHCQICSAAAAECGRSGTVAPMYRSTASVALTSGSVSSISSATLSGKDCAISNYGASPTDACKGGKKDGAKTTKAKKRTAKKHVFSYQNIYTMGGDKDSFGRARIGSGSGVPIGCSLM